MWYSVCLRRDYEEVKSRYEALQTSGDTQALKVWAEGRLKACAALFSELFGAWKAKRQAKQRSASGLLEPSEYFKIREARLATIKARLTGMGWEIQEIEKLTAESKDWGNPLFTTEPLDDQAWEQILTYSLFHLESFRKLRRREERQPWLDDLFLQMQNRLGYLYYAPRKLDNEEHPPYPGTHKPQSCSSESQSTWSSRFYACQPDVSIYWTTQENENVLPSFPHNEDILTICPELLPVLDIPSQEAFEAKLKTQDGYVEQAIHNWRDELELKLLSLLPEDTQPAELEGVDYKLMVGTTSQDARSLNLLPLGRAKLLRADAIFGWTQSELPHESCNLLYYPDDFWGTFKVTDKANLFYNPAAGYVAKALLRTIGLPNHSYLAMIGMHRKFQCGRCHDKSALTWRELVSYLWFDPYEH
ncbi:hypothetical protein FRC11_010378 [Ceratobasidium sp. 423]|nr:hypothetical protein FRC11_010378 [Ceratobasidium sp. 423]